MLLVRPENAQYQKLACAYGNLQAGDLHRTIIYVLCVVCIYHNNAVEFSGTVAMAFSPFSGASTWWSIIYVMWTSIMRQSKDSMHLTALIYMSLNFLTVSVIFLPTQIAVPV